MRTLAVDSGFGGRGRRQAEPLLIRRTGGVVESSAQVAAPKRAVVGVAHWGESLVLVLFTTALFVGASLVFLVQPLAARMVLPLFGGSQAVWTTSMLFFQAVLLLGYAYAHVSTKRVPLQRQRFVHAAVLLLPIAMLPIGRHLASPPDGASPSLWLLGVLAVTIGAPFFVVTTASPLLQRWFSATGHAAARDPYFLYAAGNCGSLLALVAYPLLVEPNVSLTRQADLWSIGYLVFAVLTLACLPFVARARATDASDDTVGSHPAAAPLVWRTRLRWVLMAFVPSSLMLGATTHIATDVASVPLVWVAPLAVYLLTFIVAFARRPLISVGFASRALLLLAPLVLLSLLRVANPPIVVTVLIHLAALFFVGALAHGRLAGERPAPEHLTEFYVLLSIGGVLGGAFNALLAPQLFDSVVEYPLALVLALLLRPGIQRASSAPGVFGRFAWAIDFVAPMLLVQACVVSLALVLPTDTDTGGENGLLAARLVLIGSAAALLLLASRPLRFALGFAAMCVLLVMGARGIYTERTFFGVLRVKEVDGRHALVHGTTLHGVQSFRPGERREPTAYYVRKGPVGDIFEAFQRTSRFARVDVIGLGVGGLAAYGLPGQRFVFYEIDPAVIRIASDPRLFTYVRDSRASVELVQGDGRLSLAKAPASSSDLLVVDAFSSDSIPVHLLTREAVELYLEKLRPQGLLVLHTSNRHLDLHPVVARVARSLGLASVERTSGLRSAGVMAEGTSWVVLARSHTRLRPLVARGWRPLADPGPGRVWTDDYSSILSVVKWGL